MMMMMMMMYIILFVFQCNGSTVTNVVTTEYPYLAPLLVLNNGSQVESAETWIDVRKPEVSLSLQNEILGTIPATPPLLEEVREINRTMYSNAQCLHVELKFSMNLSFVVEVMMPSSHATNPLPVFLTQANHRGWAQVGLSRGYVSIVYPGGDTNDVAPMFQRAYESQASMMLIMARGFVVSRVVDFLFEGWKELKNVPNVNTSQICISGHSRNGKQSLIAAAFDQRVTAVVGSSPGAPVASPYTFSSHNFYGEGPDAGVAGKWWLKSVENYATHPETIPMDGHGILAMIAPRHVMISNAYTDHEGEISFADEMNFVTARQVFELLNASSSLRIEHRPGDHHGFIDVQTYFDFFDNAFQRSNYDDLSHVDLITPAGFNFQRWLQKYASQIPPPPPSSNSSYEDRVDWTTQYRGGEISIRSVGSSYSESGVKGNRFSYISVMMMSDFDRDGSMKRLPVSFGRYVTANVYWPVDSSVSDVLHAVIWLHPYSYASGFVSSYGENSIVQDIVHQTKHIVVAFDQIGFGTRVRQGGQKFYDRHGSHASLFGHMIQDVFHAVDFLTCRKAANRNSQICRDGEIATSTYPFTLDQIPNVGSITVAGYSLGGNVALHAASLDDRIDNVASFAGFTPYRTDTNERSTYGIRRLYDLHALIPRLGLFRENPSEIPYDYDEVLSNIAPRQTLIHAPTQDRDANFDDVQTCVKLSRVSWGNFSDRLIFSSSSSSGGMTQMSINESKILCDWLLML